MKTLIVEEGEVELFVYPGDRANMAIARHYGQSADEYAKQGVRCSDGEYRNMWLVNTELVRMLLEVRPQLIFDVYRRVDGKPARKIDAYNLCVSGTSSVGLNGSPKRPEDFPKDDPFPFF